MLAFVEELAPAYVLAAIRAGLRGERAAVPWM